MDYIRECAKFVAKNTIPLQDMLQQVGIKEAFAVSFSKSFLESKQRILKLKGSLGVHTMSYKNLLWRLEIELAKKALHRVANPNFQLRLDLVNHAVAESDDSQAKKYETHHIQADYANMKLLQNELQRAIDEHNSVHCQRVTRYIS